MSKKIIFLAIFASLLSAGTAYAAKPDTGVVGAVFLRPSFCPETINHPDIDTCPRRPYRGLLTLAETKQDSVATPISLTKEDHFLLNLAPGSYVIRPVPNPKAPHLDPIFFRVNDGEVTHLVVEFDSVVK